MLNAVQFGAGNIGRGFLGQLFYESGYKTTFIDVAAGLVDQLNQRGEYPLRIVDERTYTVQIGNAQAINALDRESVAAALACADLTATAVGGPVLEKIAPLIAAGIQRRFEVKAAPPLDIIVCENLLDAGPYLREQVRRHLPLPFHQALDERVGFVEASIGRMVPVMTEALKAEDPLLVCVEEYCELPVDAEGFKGPIPTLKHMKPMPRFGAIVERKLFVHNAGHATAAYLGYHRGHETIAQAMADEAVRSEVEAALRESCEGLARKHGLDRSELLAHAADLLRRFGNVGLADQVARVAKDPIRKLGPKDRLIGAGLMCLEQGLQPEHLAFAAAAAIRYDHPDDTAAQTIQETYRAHGLSGVLEEVCRLPARAALSQLIVAGEERLEREAWIHKV